MKSGGLPIHDGPALCVERSAHGGEVDGGFGVVPSELNMATQDALNELSYFTLSHSGKNFIHQHVVDVIGAQEPSPDDKPIRLAFALVGLCLQVENGFTGREVQQAHAKLASRKHDWPRIAIPENRGEITASSVLAVPEADRESMIHQWCKSVWQAYSSEHDVIIGLIKSYQIVDSHRVRREH